MCRLYRRPLPTEGISNHKEMTKYNSNLNQTNDVFIVFAKLMMPNAASHLPTSNICCC